MSTSPVLPIQAIQLTTEDLKDPTLGRLNNLIAQLTQGQNALNGSGGATVLPNGVDVQGSTISGVGAPQSPTDAVSAGHADANYSASAVRSQLDVGGSQALKGLTYLWLNRANFADNEVPGGSIDGTNTAFTLKNAPNPPLSLNLFQGNAAFKGGARLVPGGVDYTLSGVNITMVTAPPAGVSLIACYRY